MAELLLVLGLALIWSLFYGELSAFNLLAGACIGLLLLLLVRGGGRTTLPGRLWAVTRYLLAFVREMLMAGVVIASLALRRRPRFHPHIIAVPIRVQSDAAISLLAATITLLPGTVFMGTSADRRTLYAHAIAEEDPERSRQSVTRIEDLILGFME